MKYIQLTQGKQAIVDDNMFDFINQWKWFFDQGRGGSGYAHRKQYVGKINGKYRQKTILMHRFINNTPKGLETDHINKNGLDNRKQNLRSVNQSQNKMNTGLRSDNSSGHKGISWCKKLNKWHAYITAKQIRVGLGFYDDLYEAVVIRKKAEGVYFKGYV